MQNPIQKFRQSSIVFENPGILSENLKTLTSFSPQKGAWDFFLFCLDLELFAKIENDLVSTHSFFTLLLIAQDLKKIKKIPHTLF